MFNLKQKNKKKKNNIYWLSERRRYGSILERVDGYAVAEDDVGVAQVRHDSRFVLILGRVAAADHLQRHGRAAPAGSSGVADADNTAYFTSHPEVV
jgi:hypothetical protein